MHCPNGKWDDTFVEAKYHEMVAERKKQLESSTPLDENAIMDRVLGKRRGWKKGRGRVVEIEESSTLNNQSQGQRLFTQEQVTEMITIQRQQNAYMTSLHSVLQKAGMPVPKLPKFQSVTIPGVEEDHEENDGDDDDEWESEDGGEGETEDEYEDI